MTNQRLIERVDQLIQEGLIVLGTKTPGTWGDWVDSGPMSGFRAAGLSFIHQVYGEQHPHFSEFSKGTNEARPHCASKGIAILNAVKDEIEGGWLQSIKGLVSAELFADFISMAEHLHENGYKDAAAVMTGSVLEQHLRQLCQKHDIPVSELKGDKEVPLKADRLNSELAKKSAYNAIEQKQVTAWLGLRNDAAHGNYSKYDAEQVKQMIAGVISFMARTPLQ